MRSALVSGAGGFLGRALVARLRAEGVRVFTIGREPEQGAATHFAFGAAPWTVAQWTRALDEAAPDVVFHVAGAARGTEEELKRTNVGLAEGLLDALRASDARPTLVLVGSAAEYGAGIVDGVPVTEDTACAPQSAYGRTKFAQTEAALAFGAESAARIIVPRIFNAVGVGMPRFLVLADFAGQIAAIGPGGGSLVTGNLHVSRDFIDVAHVVTALIALAETPEASGVVNVCSGVADSLQELVTRMIAKSGKNIRLETDPARVRVGEHHIIVGSNRRLAALGIVVAPTPMLAMVDALLADAQRGAAPNRASSLT